MVKLFKKYSAVFISAITTVLLAIGYFTDAKQGLIDWYEHSKADHEKIESVGELQQQIKDIQDSAITYYIPQLQYVLEEIDKVPTNHFRSMILVDAIKGLMYDTVIYNVHFKYDLYGRIWYFRGNYIYSTQDNAEAKARFYRDIFNELKKCE